MEWTSTGFTAEIATPPNRVPDYDPRSGDHLWSWALLYRATPGVEKPMLDLENLLLLTGPGCYYCEEVYTPRLASRRCKGEPR